VSPPSETFTVDLDALVRICAAVVSRDAFELRGELIHLGVPLLQRSLIEDKLAEACPTFWYHTEGRL
jgi:hypothetical protein